MWLEPGRAARGLREARRRSCGERNRIQVTDVWLRVRELFEDGQITAAKTALGYLPKDEAPDERMLAEAARQPKRLLAKLPRSMDKRATQARSWCSRALRQARNDPEAVAAMLEGELAKELPEEDVRYLWGRVALEGARVHHENALRVVRARR